MGKKSEESWVEPLVVFGVTLLAFFLAVLITLVITFR
jgi:hypothetical protein